MPTATERIPILVNKVEKARFSKKARSLGFESLSEFARTAMEHFQQSDDEEAALSALFAQVKAGTRKTAQNLDETIAYCDASNKRMQDLAAWMREQGYA